MPCNGLQLEGVEGLLKGTLKGVSGLIIKPITGTLDATAKTT